ncbi:MAG: DNA repair protein RecO [Acidobacteriota bacterium]
MRLYSAEALLVDVLDLHDRDRIVAFLTREHGLKRGVAQGARRRYSRFAGQLQPLAKAEITWFEKDGRDLVRVRGVELLRPAHRLQADLDGLLLGSYLADHVLQFAQENEASDHLYRLLDSTIEALLAGAPRDLAARYFETWVLRLQGIFPPPRECPLCGRPFGAGGAVLPIEGDALVCVDCAAGAAGTRVGREVLDALLRFGRLDLGKLAAAPPGEVALRQIEALCARLRRRFLGHELKSWEVIQEARARLPG